jgi:DNA-binding PadR family transcriptional regulator
VRRRPGQLLPLEVDILGAAADRLGRGDPDFHGFAMAKTLADASGSQRLTGHGTLYKALGRLEDSGLLESRWEDPDIALAQGRPRRRLYRITGAGQALAAATARPSASVARLRPGFTG